MSAVALLALCVLFVFLVWLYLALVRFNTWRHSDASRRAKIARWLLQRGNNATPPSMTRIMNLVNRHLHGCLTSNRPVSKELALTTLSIDEVKCPDDQLYHVCRVSDDRDQLVTEVDVSLYDVNTEWGFTSSKYGVVSCNVYFHCFASRATVEYKSQNDTVLFGVHQLEKPTSLEISVTVTSPAMKDSDIVGDLVAMVIKEYLTGIKWVDEPLVAKAIPSQWESFTPRLVSKDSFFTDNFTASPTTSVTMDTNENKDADVPQDTTLVAKDMSLSRTPSVKDSPKDNTPSSRSSYVKDDTPSVTIDNTTPVSDQSQSAGQPLPSFVLSSPDRPANTKTSVEQDTSVVDGCHDNDDSTNDIPEHPNNLNLTEVLEPEGVAIDTDNHPDHTNCHSLPVTPMKPHQSASESSDYPREHSPLLPRRSPSYEHIEELGVSPALPSNQSGSGGLNFRSNPLQSVGSAHDVLGDASETASYVSGTSNSSGLGSLLVFEFQESGITRHIAVDTTLDKPPKFRNATKLHISNDHVFVATSIKSTVVCEVCSKKIHRLLGKRNAYMCRDCGVFCHKSCHGNIKEACTNSSYNQMTINYAESLNPK